VLIDITGQRFDRLEAVEYIQHAIKDRGFWLCKCDCGNERLMEGWALRNGKNKSCGCLKTERIVAQTLTHGQARRRKQTRTYMRWKNLRTKDLTDLPFVAWQQKEKDRNTQ